MPLRRASRRCAFPLNELRFSSALQAAIIAVVLASKFAGVPQGADTRLWPYLLTGYAVLASTVPWLVGCFVEGEFGLRLSAVLGMFFALPLAASAHFLAPGAYHALAIVFWTLAALWPVHLLLSCIATVRGVTTPWESK